MSPSISAASVFLPRMSEIKNPPNSVVINGPPNFFKDPAKAPPAPLATLPAADAALPALLATLEITLEALDAT